MDETNKSETTTTTCGIGSWRPRWLQPLANPVAFLVNISFVAIVQSMAGSMIYSTMSTVEKRYAFDSKISAIIFIADSISNLILSPIIGYYGVRFNRSRLIGTGQIILALSCIASAIPYFIYGPMNHHHHHVSSESFIENENYFQMCTKDDDNHCSNNDDTMNGSSQNNTVWLAVFILFIANFFRGVGFTIYYVIALPFMDDNVSKKNSPLFLSIMHSILLIGPVFGFFLSGFCLKYSEDPWNDPGLSRTDPRYVGAWWLGFLIVGCLILIAAIPMFFYPIQFRSATVQATTIKKQMKESGGTSSALSRLIKNPLLVLYFCGNTFRYFGTQGFFMLFTKYIESQYRLSSSTASTITGSSAVLPLSFGIIFGGLFISWYRPKVRLLFILVFIVEFLSTFTIGSGIILGCDPIKLDGQLVSDRLLPIDEHLKPVIKCNNLECNCNTRTYQPICGSDSITTYFSPCHAGCTEYDPTNLTFSSCSCLANSTIATNGYCVGDQTCPNLKPYIILMMIGAFVSATAKTGNSLITLRTVEPMDKSFTNGVLSSFLSIFTFIPSPLLFGYIADSSCLIWEEKCGQRGNCWLYDQSRFRNTFLLTTISFMFMGSLFDFLMIFQSHRIKNLYGDEYCDERSAKEMTVESKQSAHLANL